MLGATTVEDTARLESILARLTEILSDNNLPPKEHPRTEAAYDRANATVEKFRREDLRLRAELDEVDKECRKMEEDSKSCSDLRNALQTLIHRLDIIFKKGTMERAGFESELNAAKLVISPQHPVEVAP